MKKISTTLLFILVLIFTYCAKKKDKETNNEMVEVYPCTEMKAILDSFVTSCNDKSLIYELYIDKIRSWDYDIVLYSGKRSLVDNGHPIMKTKISDVDIYIYSGVERYFHILPSPIGSFVTDSLLEDIPEANCWLITDADEEINILKDGTRFPFYRSHRIKFVPPVEQDK